MTYNSERKNIPTKAATKAKLQKNARILGAKSDMKEAKNQSKLHKTSRETHTNSLESRPMPSYETFEYPVGGATCASIFFNDDHAAKM